MAPARVYVRAKLQQPISREVFLKATFTSRLPSLAHYSRRLLDNDLAQRLAPHVAPSPSPLQNNNTTAVHHLRSTDCIQASSTSWTATYTAPGHWSLPQSLLPRDSCPSAHAAPVSSYSPMHSWPSLTNHIRMSRSRGLYCRPYRSSWTGHVMATRAPLIGYKSQWKMRKRGWPF